MDSPDSPLEKSITYADEIELDADQNSFSFQVAALSYQAPEMNGLECKLEGFDRDWYTVGRNSIINYSNLPYGSYTLRIKGSNSDGKWNATERVLDIHIHPPFYLSTWAYAVYTVLALCSLAAIIIYFRNGLGRSISRLWTSLSGKGTGVVYCEDRLLHECGA